MSDELSSQEEYAADLEQDIIRWEAEGTSNHEFIGRIELSRKMIELDLQEQGVIQAQAQVDYDLRMIESKRAYEEAYQRRRDIRADLDRALDRRDALIGKIENARAEIKHELDELAYINSLGKKEDS